MTGPRDQGLGDVLALCRPLLIIGFENVWIGGHRITSIVRTLGAAGTCSAQSAV